MAHLTQLIKLLVIAHYSICNLCWCASITHKMEDRLQLTLSTNGTTVRIHLCMRTSTTFRIITLSFGHVMGALGPPHYLHSSCQAPFQHAIRPPFRHASSPPFRLGRKMGRTGCPKSLVLPHSSYTSNLDSLYERSRIGGSVW